jgi:hypothetical protein
MKLIVSYLFVAAVLAVALVGQAKAEPPKIYAQDGTYLGVLSSNPYMPDSTSNPYGKYGSQYSSTSINNPYGKYGSQYSLESIKNPYATKAPVGR